MTQRYYSSTSGAMELVADITNSSTTMIVDITTGLPGSTPFTLVIDEGALTEEIVDVTGVAGTTLTITRGVDGSPASSHTAGARIRHMAIARDFREANDHVNASANVHGVTGNVVGTSDTQTLTNKTAQAASAGTKALVVKAASGQTADILAVSDSSSNDLVRVRPGEKTLHLPDTVEMNYSSMATFFSYVARFIASAAAVVGVIIKGAAAQTADLLQLQNSAGSVLAKFDKDGKLTAPQVTSTGPVSGTTGTFSGQVQSNGANVVTLTEVQTLTNKTVNGGTVNPTTLQKGGVNVPTISEVATLTNKTINGGTITGVASVSSTGTVTGSNVSPFMPFASTTVAGKRVHWMTYSSVDANRADATGIEALITHGCGFTPSGVIITPQSIALQFRAFNLTATTFDIQVVNSDGSANGTSTFSFTALFVE